MRPGTVALDVGCGTGLITNEFRRRFQRTIALDLNRWALSRMDGKPFVVKVQGDGESLPIQDESVNLIVATEMIEHLEAPEKTAREIYRVLKKNGRVVGSVPSTNNIWKWRKHLSMTCGGGEPFHRNFTQSQITKLWKDAGFKVIVKRSCLGLNWLWILEKA
jgi:ubiquinone/menaquinone biosynthesis C-methylase UbiE